LYADSVIALDMPAQRMALGAGLWWNPANSGWGISITQHAGGQMFVVWFTYDAAGSPTWFVMPGGTWTTSDTYDGRIYRTNDLASGKDVRFVATGVTDGDLLPGVHFRAGGAETHSMVMRVQTGTIRTIRTQHAFDHEPNH